MSTRPTPELLRQLLPSGVSYYGLLDSLTHQAFTELVARHGGRYVRYHHRGPFALLVLGEGDLPVTPAGDLVDFGDRTVIGEATFLSLLGEPEQRDDDPASLSFTAAALAQLLDIPAARLESWSKSGLLTPRSTIAGIPRFDFRQASTARTLVQLMSAGVSVAKLRQTLDRLQKWLPDLVNPLQQLAVLEQNGPLLVRLETGDVSEVDGQLRLSFDPEEPDTSTVRLPITTPPIRTATQWHTLGIDQERQGHLAEAAYSYRQALLVGGPDAQICFDLAHVLNELGEKERAAERYQQVIELDPTRADAWNNLGILLLELGHQDAALDAFRRAVQLNPQDLLSAYNLADALEEQGASQMASQQFRRYLDLDQSDSPWAHYAIERITR